MSGTTERTNGGTSREPFPSPRDRMLAGVPLASRNVDIDGVSTSVLEGGDGPPLILLHGGIECGGAMWAPVLAPLVAHHRVIVPDVPGLGESAPLPHLDVDTFARWFAGLLDTPRSSDRRSSPTL